jgi:Family of unknown function (DUF6279)
VRHRRPILFAALFLLALAGCSATQIAYENGATLLRWRATSYLDVQGAQSEELDRRIERFLAWHRTSALPQYARLAESCARRIEQGVTRADLEWGYDALHAQLDQSLRAAAQEIAPIMDRLTPEQIAHIEQRFAEDNREFAEEDLAGDEAARRKRWLDRNVGRLEDWIGPLSAVQLAIVRRYSETAPLTGSLRTADRRRRQDQLLAILRAHQARARLAAWAVGWDQNRTPEYAAASRAHREAYYDMLLALDRTLSAEQRASAAARFRRFARDFQILAKTDREALRSR